jgi:hypothetical protein
MAVRKLHGVETDQDGCTQGARGRDGPRSMYASYMGPRLTKMAIRTLHGVETDQDGYTQASCSRDGPRWLYASCIGGRDESRWLYASCTWYIRTKMAVRRLHGVDTDPDGCTQDARGRDRPRWLYARCMW